MNKKHIANLKVGQLVRVTHIDDTPDEDEELEELKKFVGNIYTIKHVNRLANSVLLGSSQTEFLAEEIELVATKKIKPVKTLFSPEELVL